MAGDLIGRKDFANPVNKPGTGRDVSIGTKPELGEMREKTVARGEVNFKEMHRVDGGCTFFEDDSRSFKKAIGFVHGEEQQDMRTREVIEFNRKAVDRLSVILKAAGIMINKFSKSEKAVPPNKDDS